MEPQENYEYLLFYNDLDPVEENFIYNIMQLIINYPIIWFNFLENILKNKIMISFRNNALIVSLELLTRQLKNSFNHVYRLLLDTNVVLNTIEKKGFLIIYLYSEKISEFFQNSGFGWNILPPMPAGRLVFLVTEACSLKPKTGRFRKSMSLSI